MAVDSYLPHFRAAAVSSEKTDIARFTLCRETGGGLTANFVKRLDEALPSHSTLLPVQFQY